MRKKKDKAPQEDPLQDATNTVEESQTDESQDTDNQPTEEQSKDDNAVGERDELRNKYLRLMAEFENYKKRTVRERVDLLNTAAQDTLTALLFLDDVTLENGPLMIAPGSHRGPLHSLWRNGVFTGAVSEDVSASFEAVAQPCYGPAGAVCLMHSRVAHASTANDSDRARTLYIVTYAAADAVPLSPIAVPSPDAGRIVRGREPGRIRSTDFKMETPEVPTGASFFVQQAEADVLEGLECEVVYADAYSSSVSYSSFDAYKASQYTHILVGVKSQEANSTYVVAALDDIHVALKQTTSIHRAQRTNSLSPVFWYSVSWTAFGYSPTSYIYLKQSSGSFRDSPTITATSIRQIRIATSDSAGI